LLGIEVMARLRPISSFDGNGEPLAVLLALADTCVKENLPVVTIQAN
jgi:hypothetical protein